MKKNYNTPLQVIILFLISIVQITITKAQCSFTGLNANYCTNSSTSLLSSTAAGGTFSGPGVTGSTFNPALAGPGTHTINYNICAASYSLSAGTFSPRTTAGNNVVLSDDAVSGSLPIGFNFRFYCNSYSNFYISSNGFITFSAGSSDGCCSGQFLPDPATPNNLITFGTWEDFNPSSGGTITYTTIGVAPNRILIVSMDAVPHYFVSPNPPYPQTAQIQLYETTNVIEIHTTDMTTDGGLHTMGIENATGTAANVVPGRNSSSTWSALNEMYRWTPDLGCVSSQTTVVSPTTVTILGNTPICSGSAVSLTATGNTTYTWSTSSNAANINVSPTSNTTYSVSATNAFGCVANSAITVTVNNTVPVLTVANTASATEGICPTNTAVLNAGGAITYTWAGAQPVSNGVVFSPTVASGYTVTGWNGCGTSSAVTSISVHPFPTVNTVASSNTICSGNSMTLTATGNATNYAWSGGVSNGVGFVPSATNTYVVIGTSALSCTNSASVPVTVHPSPTFPPTASPTLICLGNSSTLTSVGANTYTWASASQTVFTNTFVVTPASMGITTYTITKANTHCTDIQTINVITNPLPSVFAFVTPTLMCAFNTATLSIGGAQSYVWTAPGPPSYTFSGTNALVGPPVPTTYTVAASDGTCVTTTTLFLDVSANPTITTTPSSPGVCIGETVTITASGASSYTWASASGTLNSNIFSNTPATTTAYTVTGANAAGCLTTTNQIIFVHPNPVITINQTNTMVCNGNAVTLTASGGSSYVWDSHAGGVLTNTVLVNPSLTSSGFITYSVQGTNSLNCSSSETVQVGVYIPTLTVSGNTAACEGGPINLLVSGGNPTSYQWTDGTTVSTGQNLSTTALATVVYTISGTSNSLTLVCPAEQTVGISVSPNPTITAVPERTVFCRNDASINLIAGGGDSYSWSNAMTGATVNVAPIVNTIYTVTGTDAGTGCSNTATIEIRINPCTGINELAGQNLSIVVYPNPNNGEFTVQTINDLRLTLTNELGQLVRVIELKGANEYKVSIDGLAKGVYFINGQQDGVSFNQKIIVTK